MKGAGVGFILGNNQNSRDYIQYDPHFLPATWIAYADSSRLLNYINIPRIQRHIYSTRKDTVEWSAYTPHGLFL